jgi:hypothetical protein
MPAVVAMGIAPKVAADGGLKCSTGLCEPPRSMDERAVRRAADAHIQAVASGDVDEAVEYIFGEDVGQARANLARVAEVVTSAEVEDVSIKGTEAIVQFRVETCDPGHPLVRLETVWAEHAGRPLLHAGHAI